MLRIARNLFCFLLVGMVATQAFAHESPVAHVQTAESQAALTPTTALEKLKQGNLRFVEEKKRNMSINKARLLTSKQGQFPFAFIFSCIDSRSTPELTFDQGVGNIFTARVAGNVADTNILGSMEYAIKYAGSKLVVIMGHTQCGAVGAACTGNDFGNNLNHLLLDIRPAVSTIEKENPMLSCKDSDDINTIAKQNVINQMQFTLFESEVLRDMNDKGEVLLVGAMHNIKTGAVTFFDINGEIL